MIRPEVYLDVIGQIPQASLLLWRARRWHPIDRLVASYGQSIYCHGGMFDKDNGVSLEMLQFRGGCVRKLKTYVEDYPGRIDVFAPRLTVASACGKTFDADKAVAKMWAIVQGEYGYLTLAEAFLSHTPFVRVLIPAPIDDKANGSRAPFCSASIAIANHGGGFDAIPFLSDHRVEPGHLARSLFYRYLFTLYETEEQIQAVLRKMKK